MIAASKMSQEPEAQPLRALVVDDSQAALVALCSYVEGGRKFVVVDTASDGCEALQRARTCAPDLVVIDFDMPKLNGIDATQALLTEFPSLAIVLVSLHDSPELRCLCQTVGARGFVPKHQLGQELPAILDHIHRTLTT